MDNNHRFKKRFGQNFLNDENILNKIVLEANIPEDTLVIEIGPGSGALTDKVKEVATSVIAYEIDLELEEKLSHFDNTNVKIVWDDFLKRDIKEDIKCYSNKNIYVVANIPYYITTPIIEKIIKSTVPVDKMILMVQKEVGERFCAQPGTKNYSSISVFLNYYYDIKELFTVSRNCFFPKPNVDSVIISLDRKKEKYVVKDENRLFNLIRDSFRFKRKNLKNNLRDYDLIKIEEILKKYNMTTSVRAENLSLDIFVDISNNL